MSESEQHTIQLGLCCLNTDLRKQKIFCSRKPILRTVTTKGLDYLKSQCLANCQDLIKMIEWNHLNGIKVFRISSELFPHYANPRLSSEMQINFTLDFAQDLLEKAGDLATQYGQRLTFHPGQYNVIASPNQDAWEKTIKDLDMHAEILDKLGAKQDSVMVLHGGGTYKNKDETMTRWINRFYTLPERVQKYLVLENCEKNFHIEDCLKISKQTNVPVVFDTHHYTCYNQLHPSETFKPESDYLFEILESWNRRNIKPKFHVSEQGIGKIGKHSDLIENLPNFLLDLPEKHQQSIDIMIEAKLKEQAIFKLYSKYPKLDLRLSPSLRKVYNTPPAQRKKIIIKKIQKNQD